MRDLSKDKSLRRDIFEALKSYIPAGLTFFAAGSVHFLQLRHLLLRDLKSLSDTSFFVDMSTELVWAVLAASVISKFVTLMLAARSMDTVIYLSAAIFFYCRRFLRLQYSDWDIRARNFEDRVSKTFDESHGSISILIFIPIFYIFYCGVHVSFGGVSFILISAFGLVIFGSRFVFGKLRDVYSETEKLSGDQLMASIRWPRAVMVLGLLLILVSFILASSRGHFLISRPCLDVALIDSSIDCYTIVGKSDDGLFVYYAGDDGGPRFIAFTSISYIGPSVK